MNVKSKIVDKILNESIESRIEEISKKIGEIQEVDNFDLEVGLEYEYKKDEDSKPKMITFLKRGKNSSHGPFYFLDRNGNEIMLGEKQLKKMEKKYTKQEETEGNAFTKKLKDTPKGEKFKMGNKEYTDNSSLEEMIHSELEEKLYGGQKKLDKNHNGRIDSEDFKMLRKGKKSEMDEDLGGMEDSHPDFGEVNLSNLSDEDKKGKFAKYYRNPLSLKDNRKEDEEEDYGTMRSRFFDKEDQEDEFDNLAEGDKKFIQKATEKMDKKGSSGKFGAWCKKEGLDKDGEVTKKCIDKAMKSDDSKVVKMANFAKNIGGFKGVKHESVEQKNVIYNVTFGNEEVTLSENEVIDLIEDLVNEEKKSVGMVQYNKISKNEKDINTKALKDVEKKMSDYVKAGSKGKFEMNPKMFPKGNGELGKMNKKAYKASKAVEEYIENFAYSPGMENLQYDEIKPNEDWLEKNIEGHAMTGNSPEYANAVKTDLGKKINAKRKANLYGKEKNRSYNRVKQPVDVAGEGKGEDSLDKMFKSLGESVEIEKNTLVNEEMERMKTLLSYTNKKV